MKYLTILALFALCLQSAWGFDNCGERWEQSDILDDNTERFFGHCDGVLKKDLQYFMDTNQDLGYTAARQIMFGTLDNDGGYVCGVYSDLCVRTNGIPNPSLMNCEHSWPQSRGAVGIAKSDLHHLYPVDSKINSRRSNLPFCEVVDVVWEGKSSVLGKSESGTRCFEPADEHKGDLARAMFYFATRYNKQIDFEQEYFFRKWNKEDPVSDKELKRNDDTESFQGNRNIFVDYPEMVELINDF